MFIVLINHVLGFAKKQVVVKTLINIHDIIARVGFECMLQAPLHVGRLEVIQGRRKVTQTENPIHEIREDHD